MNAVAACTLKADALAEYSKLVLAVRKTSSSVRVAMNAAKRAIRKIPPESLSGEACESGLEALDGCERCFVDFLMLWGYVRPSYEFLLSHKFAAITKYGSFSPHGSDLVRLQAAARDLRFGRRHIESFIPQVVLRVLIHTGKSLEQLTPGDLHEFREAVKLHELKEGRRHKHYVVSIHAVENVLYHMGVFKSPAVHASKKKDVWGRYLARVRSPALKETIRRYLDYICAILKRSTVEGYANALCQFAEFVESIDPEVRSFGQLDRRRHIEPWVMEVAKRPLSASHKRTMVMGVKRFLDDLDEWAWEESPRRRLLFLQDIPKASLALPRYIPPEQDLALRKAFLTLEDPYKRSGLVILRNAGLRMGELLSLELDCVHEVPGRGAWLKVPLGKLKTERMVPLDEETLSAVDEVVRHRGSQRPIPDPETGRLVEYLFVRRGKRVSADFIREGLKVAARRAGIKGNVVPHQLRHTYATTLVNAGVSLPVLMHLLGHKSMKMTLRYARLFDSTVRAQYEEALEAMKRKYSPAMLALAAKGEVDTSWIEGDGIKERLVHGRCVRPYLAGPCPHANACYGCPFFEPDSLARRCMKEQLGEIRLIAKDAAARGLVHQESRQKSFIDAIEEILRRPEFRDGRSKSKGAGKPRGCDTRASEEFGAGEHIQRIAEGGDLPRHGLQAPLTKRAPRRA